MARKSRKAEELKQKIISSVPVEQRKMITQPVTFTFLNGEMSMMQTRIQTMIMEKLQDRIRKALEKRLKSGDMGDLFSQEDYQPISEDDRSMYLAFSVAYSELGVEPTHYNDVDVAARNMQSIVYERETRDGYRYEVVFPVVDVPKVKEGERRQNIRLYMTERMAKEMFKVIPYHRYLKDAIFLFSSNYAGRIYLLINANKHLGTWAIEYETLRKILLTTYDEKTKTPSVNKYKDISDFKKRVLEPARKEIAEAADRIDCTFDYEFQYPAGKKRGTPDKIIFHIHLTDLGRNISQSQLDSQEATSIRDRLIRLRLTVSEVNRYLRRIPSGMLNRVGEKVSAMEKMREEIRKGTYQGEPVNNFTAYLRKTLDNLVDDLNAIPEAEVVEEAAPSCQSPAACDLAPLTSACIDALRAARTLHIEEGDKAFNDVLRNIRIIGTDKESHRIVLRQEGANLNHSLPWYWTREDFGSVIRQHYQADPVISP